MDYEFTTTTGEIIKAHSAPYSSVQIDELLGRVLNEDVGGGVFWAEYGVTTYQEVLSAYTDGEICALRKNSIYDQDYSLTFVLAEKNEYGFCFYSIFSHWSDNCIVEWAALEDSNQWSVGHRLLENSDLKVNTISPEDSIAQYPSSPAVYAYGQNIDAAAQGYANAAEEAAKDYTDEQLEPVAAAAGKAEDYALAAYVSPTASGAIASFDDGAEDIPVKSLVVDIEPVQDLNGYANPWPPGGGKNKFDGEFRQGSSISLENTTRIAGENLIPVIAGKTYSFSASDYTSFNYVLNSSITGELPFPAENYSQCGTSVAWANTAITFTATNDGYVAIVVKKPNDSTIAPSDVSAVKMQFEESATPTAYEPYSNICLITGWTGAKVQRTGKNLITSSFWYTTGIAIYATALFMEIEGDLRPETEYTLSFEAPSGYKYYLNEYLFDGYVSFTTKENRTIVHCKTLSSINKSSASQYEPGRGWAILKNNQNQPGNINFTNLQLELGSTATAYESYQGDTFDISFPDEAGTVYGGTLDVTGGKLVVDRAMKVFSGDSSEGWAKSDYGYFSSPRINDAIDKDAEQSDFQSNLYAYGYVANSNATLGACLIWGCVRVRLADMSISLDEWKAQLASLPMQVVYTLANPIEITLTPTQIATLLGMNNIYADTGDTEVTYRADPTRVYEKIMNAMLAMTGGN